MLRKLLCWFGFHKVDENDWVDSFRWGEGYVYEANWCSECGELITRSKSNKK